jgi:ribosomal protein S18 acetylase RimI-like enzyme
MRIRRATRADLPSLAPLFDQYRQFYDQPSDLPTAEAFLADRLEREESVIFLAELGGKIVGFTQLYPLFSSTRCRRLWLLNDLFVDTSARGKGVAKGLLEMARVHAVATGACGIELSTAHTNHPAQQLYESLGYTLDTRFRVYSLKL